jgi:hypothetical protein
MCWLCTLRSRQFAEEDAARSLDGLRPTANAFETSADGGGHFRSALRQMTRRPEAAAGLAGDERVGGDIEQPPQF